MTDRVGQRVDRYRLLQVLGSGGFGTVYLAEQIRDGIRVALKLLPQLASEELHSFLTEARMIRLKHPHIVQILDFGLDEQTPFLVMTYASHGTLRQRHPKGTRVPLPTVVSYVQQLAGALQFAHNEQIIHRDVKPENMLLDEQDRVLLSDFGIATMIAQSVQLSTQTMAGTLPYMAPEQTRGHPSLASDQYALAVVVYEWLCGQRPFRGNGVEIALQHRLDPPPPLRAQDTSIPADVEHVVLTALAKEPTARFTNVQAFATALELAAGTRTPDDLPSSSTRMVLGTTTPLHPIPIHSVDPFRLPDSASELNVPRLRLPGNLGPADTSSPLPPHSEWTAVKSPSFIEPPVSAPAPLQTQPPAAGPAPPTGGMPALALPYLYTQGEQLSQPITITSSQSSPAHVGSLSGRIVLLSLLVLLVVGSSGTWAVLHFMAQSASATATAQANSQTTATAQANETATAIAQAATATAIISTYPFSTNQVLNDPLIDNSKNNQWETSQFCKFQGSAYHAVDPQTNTFTSCSAVNTDYANFTFEVEASLKTGDGLGIIFRGNAAKTQFYRLAIYNDGSYGIYVYVDPTAGNTRTLKTGNLAQTPVLSNMNTIAVVARGATMTLYFNQTEIVNFTDSTYMHGQIGVSTTNLSHSADAVFTNAKVWKLP